MEKRADANKLVAIQTGWKLEIEFDDEFSVNILYIYGVTGTCVTVAINQITWDQSNVYTCQSNYY